MVMGISRLLGTIPDQKAGTETSSKFIQNKLDGVGNFPHYAPLHVSDASWPPCKIYPFQLMFIQEIASSRSSSEKRKSLLGGRPLYWSCLA